MRREETNWNKVSKDCFEAVLKKAINDLEIDTNAAHNVHRKLRLEFQKDYVRKDTIKYIAGVLLFIIAIIEIFIRF